jgi:hypothetical protein
MSLAPAPAHTSPCPPVPGLLEAGRRRIGGSSLLYAGRSPAGASRADSAMVLSRRSRISDTFSELLRVARMRPILS